MASGNLPSVPADESDQLVPMEADADPRPAVSAIRCSPDRTVFTEDGNDDGWLATDTTVDVRR